MQARAAIAAIAGTLAILAAAPGAAEDPLIVARAFVNADGNGYRLSPYEWRRIAPMVTWELEPAWDRVVLIRGYEISTPRRLNDRIEVEIVYTVVSEVTAGGVDRGEDGDEEDRRDAVTLKLVSNGDRGWLVDGAPPPPHVFAHVVDAEALVELLQPRTQYQSNSSSVWLRLRAAGHDVSYATTSEIPTSSQFEEVGTAEPGDVALYFAYGAPYHVGLVDGEDAVWSSSLNAGAVVAPFAAFPGAVRYWRPLAPQAFESAAGGTPSPAPLRRR